MTTRSQKAQAELDALTLVAAWRQRDTLGTAPLLALVHEYVPSDSPAVPLILALVGQLSHTSDAMCKSMGFDVEEFFRVLGVERAQRVNDDLA